MLPRQRRIRRADDHLRTTRSGRRASSGGLVVHLLVEGDQPARAGFVVGRQVGGSVVRHRVTRRLRYLVAVRVPDLPQGCALVVRALPRAAACSSAELARDLDSALARLIPGAGQGQGPRSLSPEGVT